MDQYGIKDIEKAKLYVHNLLKGLPSNLLYHNAFHTFNDVYPQAMILASAQQLKKRDTFLVAISALFHDTGFVKQYVDNERIGARYLFRYMKQEGYSEKDCFEGVNAIINTDMRNDPKTVVEEVLRDADLSYLSFSRDQFLQHNQNLRWELFSYPKSPLHNFAKSGMSWLEESIDFMNKHSWFSTAGKFLYTEQKQENLKFLKDQFVKSSKVYKFK